MLGVLYAVILIYGVLGVFFAGMATAVVLISLGQAKRELMIRLLVVGLVVTFFCWPYLVRDITFDVRSLRNR